MPGRMWSLDRKRRLREARLRSSLRSVVRQLKGMGAVKIVLFGSLARGEVHTHSDLDLLVVMPASRSGREWAGRIYSEVRRGVACDILVFNEEELARDLPASRFLRHVLASGRALYEKAG
ncbi:MAG: nucleotidyltransferase domain-containing protein [Thermoplasmata archaeon]